MTNRELDAYLAEHLFGDADLADAIKYAAHYIPNGPNAFSSTGDGMLLVLEAMRGRGIALVIDSTYDLREWHVSWREDRVVEINSSLPLAVALAAKAALEASIQSQVIDA